MYNNNIACHKLAILVLWLLLACNFMHAQEPRQNPAIKQKVQTDYCQGVYFSVTLGSDKQGCYFDIEYKPNWSASPGCNLSTLPHGLDIKFTNATIPTTNSVVHLAGTWTANATQHLLPGEVYWNKPPVGTCLNATNAVTNAEVQKKRIYVTPGPGTVTVTVSELQGYSWPTNPSMYTCAKDFSFDTPAANYSIGGDMDVCAGSALTLSVQPAPPAGAVVEWYASNAPCPLQVPGIGAWGTPFSGGPQFNTNAINNSKCYVAVIKLGCWKYISNVKRITVCPGTPSAAITSVPALPLVEGMPAACNSWSGTLLLSPSTFPCNTTYVWEKFTNGVWTEVANSWNKPQIHTSALVATSCRTIYQFRVRMKNACGESIKEYSIAIYKNPTGGSINTLTNLPVDVGIGTSTAPIVCEETRLQHKTDCGKIIRWEYRDEITVCSNNYPAAWTVLPGAGTAPVWWTNALTKSRQYRVLVGNGPCATTYSNPITVKVKPPLSVQLTSNGTILCPGKPVLTASSSYGGACNYPVIYNWHLNGELVFSGPQATYIPTRPGKYYVEAIDTTCSNKRARSSTILICRPELVIEAPCCVCPKEKITLSAIIKNTCGNPATYLWNTNATTPQITVNAPGTYTVQVTIGGCTFIKTVTIGKCP
jgi:hypothetical protein